jgi:hypothetical protein
MAVLLQPGREPLTVRNDAAGAWIALDTLQASTGWELKPEGACLGDLCVPIPRGRESEFVDGDAFNIVALIRQIGAPAVYHESSQTWAVGESRSARCQALNSLEAPDFTLPDLEGRMHSLSDYRGRKVFLASWASW